MFEWLYKKFDKRASEHEAKIQELEQKNTDLIKTVEVLTQKYKELRTQNSLFIREIKRLKSNYKQKDPSDSVMGSKLDTIVLQKQTDINSSINKMKKAKND